MARTSNALNLSSYVDRYTKLRSWWEKARSVITESARTSEGIELYQLVPGDICDEVRLRICGALAYIRFTHNFTVGRLEYGALLVSADSRPVKYERIKDIEFDEFGKVDGHLHFVSEDEQGRSFRHLHRKTLTEAVQKIVEVYFSDFSETQDPLEDERQV